MPLISPEHLKRLRDRFEEALDGGATITLERHASCETCERTEVLLREIASTSGLLELALSDAGDGSAPIIGMGGRSRGVVRFLGPPSGYELPAFIDSIIDCANGATSLASETTDALASLAHEMHLRVFTTPT